MKFTYFGYQAKTIEVRKMAMCDIVTCIAQKLIEKGRTDMEVRFVDLFMGDVTKWAGIEGMLIGNINRAYEVHFYNACIMHDNQQDVDYVKVIISDDVDEEGSPVLRERGGNND